MICSVECKRLFSILLLKNQVHISIALQLALFRHCYCKHTTSEPFGVCMFMKLFEFFIRIRFMKYR